MKIKSIFVGLFFVLLFSFQNEAKARKINFVNTSPPKIMVVKFHADWCVYCIEMGTMFEELEKKYRRAPSVFLSLDLTTDNTRYEAEKHVYSYGIEDVYANSFATGQILILDFKTKEILKKMTKVTTLEQAKKEINEILGLE